MFSGSNSSVTCFVSLSGETNGITAQSNISENTQKIINNHKYALSGTKSLEDVGKATWRTGVRYPNGHLILQLLFGTYNDSHFHFRNRGLEQLAHNRAADFD